MIVADLKQHLSDLAALLEKAGAGRPIVKDFIAIGEALDPFRDRKIPDFVEFLRKAHEYQTTGVFTAKPTRSGTPKAPKKPKVQADPQQVAARIRQLYDSAADLSLPVESFQTELQVVDGLNKPGLLEVAEALELSGMKSKTIPVIRDAIRQRVLNRRGAAQRAGMTSQPIEQTPAMPVA